MSATLQYLRSDGWDYIAGQDISRGRVINRYMLAVKPSEEANKRAVVFHTTKGNKNWTILFTGTVKDATQLFDGLDN